MKSENLISGLKWSFLERAAVIVLQIALEILLARLLLPSDYGLLGMIAVVIAVSNVFVDGGFSNALIQFQDRTENDESVVFYLSLLIGVAGYGVLFFTAPALSNFFEQDLTLLLRILGIGIIFNAFGVLYRARMVISLNFKKQTLYSALSMAVSGIVALGMAYGGFGVWALVVQMLIYSFLFNFFLFNHFWTVPYWGLQRAALKRMLGFGSKIFVSSVIHAVYFNAYPILLGRLYSAPAVGLYTKANQLTVFPAGLFSSVLQRVLFPYLSAIQSDRAVVYGYHLKVVKWYSLIVFPLAALVISYAEPLILWLMSDRWRELVLPLQILLSAAVFFPIIILNMNIFQVLGKGGLFLRTEILTKVIGIAILFFTFRHGFIILCLGILLQTLIQFLITSVISSKILGSNSVGLFFTVLTILFFSLLSSGVLWYLSDTMTLSAIWAALLGIVVFMGLYLLLLCYFYARDISEMMVLLNNAFR